MINSNKKIMSSFIDNVDSEDRKVIKSLLKRGYSVKEVVDFGGFDQIIVSELSKLVQNNK